MTDLDLIGAVKLDCNISRLGRCFLSSVRVFDNSSIVLLQVDKQLFLQNSVKIVVNFVLIFCNHQNVTVLIKEEPKEEKQAMIAHNSGMFRI